MLEFSVAWLAGFALRIIQILVESSLYLLIGFLTAGMLRSAVGSDRVRAWFGVGRIAAPLRAWLVATMLLPVCSLGVLPILYELRRAGVARHAILTFALAAPMLNPISLISCLSYLGPNLLVLLMAGSFVVALGAGVLLGPGPTSDPHEESAGPPPESGRLSAVTVTAARVASGPILVDIAAGLVGAGLMAASLAPADLASSMFVGDPWVIGRMVAITPLTYATPDKAMVALPEMVKFRQSAGAMFALIALGVGMTLGTVTWTIRAYGIKTFARWGATVLVLTLAVASGVDGVTPAVGTANSDNDHFNDFANPFEGMGGWPDLGGALVRYAREVEPLRWATVLALVALVVAGVYCRKTGKDGLAPTGQTKPRLGNSIWKRPMPPRVISSLGAGVLGAVGVVGLYAYFPPPSEVFQDMSIIKADFFGELSWRTLDPARHHLDLWERQASKLTTGSWLRFHPANLEARRRTEELQAALHQLRGTIDTDNRAEARSLSLEISHLQGLCQRAYLVQ